MDLNTAVQKIIQEKYERKVDMENGVVLKIWNVHDVKGGKVILGDGAAYYEVKYNALTFIPELHEIIEGEVTEVMDFGLFVNIGPFDGLVHLSQITNEFISFDRKAGSLTTRNTRRIIKKGDVVRAKIVTVSMKPTIPETKIALTLKGEGLGKLEWLTEEKKEKKERKEKTEKKEKKEKK
jgi:DNA-directed RNA polymerase subunit E'